METITIKTKQHRSGLRVWLEGKRPKAAGFLRGRRYESSYLDGSIVLTLDPQGSRKVAGRKRAGATEWTPIIDLCGAKVSEALNDAKQVEVIFKNGYISISDAVIA